MKQNINTEDILESYLGLDTTDTQKSTKNSTTEEPVILPEDIEEECECYDSCENIKFNDVVGARTLKDGGIFGSLLQVARVNIEDSKARGELTESSAGEVYSKALEVAMQQAVMYELSHGKAQKEIALTVAQTKYQYNKMMLERNQFDLEEYVQKNKLTLERELNAANIRKINQDIKYSDQQIENIKAEIIHLGVQDRQIEQQIEQSRHEVIRLDAETSKIYQDINYSKAQVRNIDAQIVHLGHQNALVDKQVEQITHELDKIDAEVTHISHQNDLIDKQVEQITHELNKIDAEVDHLEAQDALIANQTIESQWNALKIKAETDLVDQKVLSAQKEILKIQAQIDQIECQCANEDKATSSKIALNTAQADKLSCDCTNSTAVMTSQANLYEVQAEGFRDNARQKLFEVQAQAYAMVFEAADQDVIATCFDDLALNTTFDEITDAVYAS